MGSVMQEQSHNNGGVANESNPIGFAQFDIATDFSDHKLLEQKKTTPPKIISDVSKAISKEWRILQKGLPESIYVRVYEGRIDLMRAAIVGARNTPYHGGLFFFDIMIPPTYPNVPPRVVYHSFGLRLNPNLYENGFVCLSLLNTWNGPPATRWNSGQSSILQVLVSLQALVLNEVPYKNEPLVITKKGTRLHESMSASYSNKAFIYSCKTMRKLLERPPLNFKTLVEDHFKANSHFILSAYLAYANGFVKVGKYQDDGSFLPKRLRLPKSHVKEMRQLLPYLYMAFKKHDDSLHEFAEQLNDRISRKYAEYIEKAKPKSWFGENVKHGFLKWVCGSSASDSKFPILCNPEICKYQKI